MGRDQQRKAWNNNRNGGRAGGVDNARGRDSGGQNPRQNWKRPWTPRPPPAVGARAKGNQKGGNRRQSGERADRSSRSPRRRGRSVSERRGAGDGVLRSRSASRERRGSRKSSAGKKDGDSPSRSRSAGGESDGRSTVAGRSGSGSRGRESSSASRKSRKSLSDKSKDRSASRQSEIAGTQPKKKRKKSSGPPPAEGATDVHPANGGADSKSVIPGEAGSASREALPLPKAKAVADSAFEGKATIGAASASNADRLKQDGAVGANKAEAPPREPELVEESLLAASAAAVSARANKGKKPNAGLTKQEDSRDTAKSEAAGDKSLRRDAGPSADARVTPVAATESQPAPTSSALPVDRDGRLKPAPVSKKTTAPKAQPATTPAPQKQSTGSGSASGEHVNTVLDARSRPDERVATPAASSIAAPQPDPASKIAAAQTHASKSSHALAIRQPAPGTIALNPLEAPDAHAVGGDLVIVGVSYRNKRKIVKHLRTTRVGELAILHLPPDHVSKHTFVVVDPQGLEIGKDIPLGSLGGYGSAWPTDGSPIELTFLVDEWADLPA